MQNTLKQTAESMIARAYKTFTFEEVVKFGKQPHKNLPEILGQYPNQGVGFKIWRKTWPQDRFIIVKEAQFKNLRNAKFYGVEYWKERARTPQPIKVRNGSKRGVWRYDCQGTNALTETNVYYSAEELKAFYDARLQKV